MNRRELLHGIGTTLAVSVVAGPTEAQELDPSTIHVCTEIQQEDLNLAFNVAAAEFRGNNPGAERTQAAALIKKKWNPKRRFLNVDFLSHPTYIDKVKSKAKLWEELIGITFRFGHGEPNILVAFDAGGSWSDIGTDSVISIARGMPSMNFGWFTESTTEAEFTRTTLHEFGHALGLIHEHLHPRISIPWRKTAVENYYGKLGWSPAKVKKNIYEKYDVSQLNFSSYDRHSIMHYSLPREFVSDESFVVERNWALSDTDQRFISEFYPRVKPVLPG